MRIGVSGYTFTEGFNKHMRLLKGFRNTHRCRWLESCSELIGYICVTLSLKKDNEEEIF